MQKRSPLHINTDDSLLLALLREGDEQAYTLLYNRYHKMLYVLALKYLKDQSMAEEAVQHVYVKLWEFHAELNIKVNIRNYLYTMVKNYILNEIRNRNSAIVKQYEQAQTYLDYEDDLVEKIEERELMGVFYKAIHLLPEQKKRVCLLKIEERCSNQEIAERLQISIHTVKTHYAQSVKLLRGLLGKMLVIIFFCKLFMC